MTFDLSHRGSLARGSANYVERLTASPIAAYEANVKALFFKNVTIYIL